MQNVNCSKTHLDGTTHEQLFAGHVMGSRPMKSKKKIALYDTTGFGFTSVWIF